MVSFVASTFDARPPAQIRKTVRLHCHEDAFLPQAYPSLIVVGAVSSPRRCARFARPLPIINRPPRRREDTLPYLHRGFVHSSSPTIRVSRRSKLRPRFQEEADEVPVHDAFHVHLIVAAFSQQVGHPLKIGDAVEVHRALLAAEAAV